MDGATTDPLAELQILAARHVLGLAHSWEFPPVADRALASHLYSPSIAELAGMSQPIMSDVAPLLERALGELGLALPARADAARTIARHCMERLASTAERPFDVLRLLNDAAQAATDVLPNDKFVGSGLDAGPLVGIYWSYTEPNENWYAAEQRLITDEGERHALLDSLARREAKAWLERHCPETTMNDPTPSLPAETDTLRVIYAALNRNDIPAMVSAFAPDIERIEPADFPQGGTYHGLAAVTAHIVKARSTWAEGSCEPQRFIVSPSGDCIIVIVEVRVRLKHETQWREGRTADAFTFRNGKVIQFRTFFDERQALEWAADRPH